MKKIKYSVINHNNNNIDIIFYIFGDGICTNLNPDWTTYGYFRFYRIDDYLDFLNEYKNSYANYSQHLLNYNSSAVFSADKVISDIQQLYEDNKQEYPKEKTDFIKTFDDANMMQLVAFQTENQELIKWFYNLNGENTDSALAGNLALTDDTLALLLKRNAYKYIPFINKNRHFSKQILDLLIKIDKNLFATLFALIPMVAVANTTIVAQKLDDRYGEAQALRAIEKLKTTTDLNERIILEAQIKNYLDNKNRTLVIQERKMPNARTIQY